MSNSDMIVIDNRWGGEMCCVCFATPRRGREWEGVGRRGDAAVISSLFRPQLCFSAPPI